MHKQSIEVIKTLKKQSNKENVAGMARFGINSRNTLGVPMPVLRRLAHELGKDHALALALWDSGIHEARILAGLIAEPARLNDGQMERWVKDFDSWDVCDQVCSNLFDKTPAAAAKAAAWSRRTEEYVKRAGFVVMAALAVHNKTAPDAVFRKFLPLVLCGARDERNFVRKGVNWALRQIGKRNQSLNRAAIAMAREIAQLGTPAARWIAGDALRELESPEVRLRLRKKEAQR
jgi:3-methyladenine DNA glycosylase AlkD